MLRRETRSAPRVGVALGCAPGIGSMRRGCRGCVGAGTLRGCRARARCSRAIVARQSLRLLRPRFGEMVHWGLLWAGGWRLG
jgi:hypothetical protein